MGATNDMWVWVLSYAFFFITLISAIFVAIKHPALRKASIRAVVAMLFPYALFIWNSLYRLDITEFRTFLRRIDDTATVGMDVYLLIRLHIKVVGSRISLHPSVESFFT
ncbi:hypothetical protein [Exiguobacterium sp.]|uniref:hypothetical protein n=1 Tax=Exiguobacterium sp. TaxID=44751 RepID=UPI000ED38A5D|nr:hypothetical protein [Exiguobacterium sp.]HAL00076.1 hypothetical protein [Exiguobacterium sp.]